MTETIYLYVFIFVLILAGVGVAIKGAIDTYVRAKLWWYGFKKAKNAKNEDAIDYYSQL